MEPEYCKTNMSSVWLAVKSVLDKLENITTFYVNEKGDEVPIKSECEFQEALRVAKTTRGNQLKLIFVIDNMKKKETFSNKHNKFECFSKSALRPQVPEARVLCRYCKKNSEWLTKYLNKFYKCFRKEIKYDTYALCKKMLDEDKMFSELKRDIDVFFDQKFSDQESKKKRKKFSEKKMDLCNYRDAVFLKKLEKLQASKCEKSFLNMKKLDRTTTFRETKRRILENKSYCKSGTEPEHSEPFIKHRKSGKSGCFSRTKYLMQMPSGASFQLMFEVGNDGGIQWSMPKLQLFATLGFCFDSDSYILPKLKPGEITRVILKGTVTTEPGLYCLQCGLVDGIESLSKQLTCRAKVYTESIPQNCFGSTVSSSISSDIDHPNKKRSERHSSEQNVSDDFLKNAISSSQKKIEENILEIEKKLKDIEFVRSNFSSGLEENMGKVHKEYLPQESENCNAGVLSLDKKKESRDAVSKKVFNIESCDGEIREGTKFRGEKSGSKEDPNLTNESTYIKENVDDELEYDVVPSFSIFCLTEEEEEEEEEEKEEEEEDEDNFILVPFSYQKPHKNPRTTGKNVKKENIVANLQPYSALPGKMSDFVPNADELDSRTSIRSQNEPANVKKEIEISVIDEGDCNQLTWTKSRDLAFQENELLTLKADGIKVGNSTDYNILASDWMHPIFPVQSEMKNKDEEPFLTFTCPLLKDKERTEVETSQSQTQTFGKVVCEVDNDGCCRPVNSSSVTTSGIQCEVFNKVSKGSSKVDILPNSFVSGAANMASLAINTAKSVINSLQSAFVLEGKTELGEPACEDKNSNQGSMEAMFQLHEMGFSDLQMNRRLLVLHNNDLFKVIEDLVGLQQRKPKSI